MFEEEVSIPVELIPGGFTSDLKEREEEAEKNLKELCDRLNAPSGKIVICSTPLPTTLPPKPKSKYSFNLSDFRASEVDWG